MGMRKHIELLARKLDATVYFDQSDWVSVSSRISTREAWVAPVDRNRFAYWTALHELGHIETSTVGEMVHVYRKRNNATLDIEARAWLWAIENAMGGLDEKGHLAISIALGSYFRDYEITKASSAVLEVLTRVVPNRHLSKTGSEYGWIRNFERAREQFLLPERSDYVVAA